MPSKKGIPDSGPRSKMAATAAVGMVLLNAGLSFVAPGTLAPRLSDAATLTHMEGSCRAIQCIRR